MSPGLRRVSAVVAITALAIGGAKIASDHTMPGAGFSTVQTAAADPTGPTGGPGNGGMNGGQFQPPGLPPQQPDYQGGNNLPPLDQNSGISIYNSGAPQAGQQPGGQPPQQGSQQPQHGTQIPDYQTATPYTQGPGEANPDFQEPQQNSPQQGQQEPSQAPTQTQQPNQDQDHSDQQQNQQRCKDGSAPGQPLNLSLSGMDKLPSQIASMMQQAIQMWQSTGRTNITSQSDSGQNQDGASSSTSVSVVDNPLISWAGLFVPAIDGKPPEILINLAKLSGNQEADTALVAHEIGHGMALPDTASRQIMDHDGMTRALSPTPADVESLQQMQNLTCAEGPQALKEISEGCPPFLSAAECDFWERMTPGERAVCTERYTLCAISEKVTKDRHVADKEALDPWRNDPKIKRNEQGQIKQDDNIIDAAHHCIWSALMTQSVGESFAMEMTDAHEVSRWEDPRVAWLQTVESTTMDLMNNRIGRLVGSSNGLDRRAAINECVSRAKAGQMIPKTMGALSAADPKKLVYFE